MRIDKFLKVSRIIKRRTVAKDVCDEERIYINGNPCKPSKEVKVGDIVTVKFGNRSLSVRVLATDSVVTKAQASELYEIVEEN